MDIELPSGITQEQVKQFLTYLKTKPVSEPHIDKDCSNCRFGHSRCLISLNCINEVAEHKEPSRWLPKEA